MNPARFPKIPLSQMKVLIACRGPIAQEALRVIRRCEMPLPDLIVSRREWFDSFESRAPWLSSRDLYHTVHCVDEYSDMEAIVRIAFQHGIDAIYVGYGFLAENADFARRCEDAGIRFVGPPSNVLGLVGNKERSRRIAQSLKVPVVPGVELIEKSILLEAARIKAEAEGGALRELWDRVQNAGLNLTSATDEVAALFMLWDRVQNAGLNLTDLSSQIDEAVYQALFQARQEGKQLFSDEELISGVEREILKLWEHGPEGPAGPAGVLVPVPTRRGGTGEVLVPGPERSEGPGGPFPVRIKASAGGGGKGQRVVAEIKDVPRAMREVWSEIGAAKTGASKSVILERNLLDTRHMEVQILGDGENFVHFAVRDCSLQTMFYQKLVEIAVHEGQLNELKAKFGPDSALYLDFNREIELLRSVQADAVKLVSSLGYRGAGTVEFLVDPEYRYYFMEVNARIQVEHGVSEEISRVRGEKVSLVAQQLKIAAGDKIDYQQRDITFAGYSLETRVSLLDAMLQPAPGAVIERFSFPKQEGVRIEDSGIENALSSGCGYNGQSRCGRPGITPLPMYDANVALNIYSGNDWQEVLSLAIDNLRRAQVSGKNLATTIPFHIGILTWLRANQPYPRITTSVVPTYLCLLARIKRRLSERLRSPLDPAGVNVAGERSQSKAAGGNRRSYVPWQTMVRDVLSRLSEEPAHAASLCYEFSDSSGRHGVERFWNLVSYLRIALWPEDELYLRKGMQFQRALNDLCHHLGIDVGNALLTKTIADVEGVTAQEVSEALEKKLSAYQGIALIADELHSILTQSELAELKRREGSTLVSLPQSLKEPHTRAGIFDEFGKFPEPADGAIVSPILGIFYRSPKPGFPPFVEIGTSVKKGQTLALVGAMKVYTEVQAPHDGVVTAIVAAADSLVKPGQKLMILDART